MTPLLAIAAAVGIFILGAYTRGLFARAGALLDRLIADDLHDVPMGLPDDEETR